MMWMAIFVLIGGVLGGVINRLRGRESYFVWLGCVVLALAVWVVSHNPMAAGLVGGLYVLGESFGWTKVLWATRRPLLTQAGWNNHPYLLRDDTGERYGIYWLAEKLAGRESADYRKFWKVGAAIRGAYWWVPVYAPLVAFGITPWWVAIPAVLGLSLAFFPIYDNFYGENHNRSEIAYGVLYGAVLGGSIAMGVL